MIFAAVSKLGSRKKPISIFVSMNPQINTILVAATGLGATLGAAQIIPTPDEISMIGQLLIQLAIGIATIWKLFKDRKKIK